MSVVGLVHRLICCSPASWLLHCDEGWTAFLVEQVLVDAREASMILVVHLVDVNHSVGWSDEACFRFALFVRTRKKNVIRGPEASVCRFVYFRSQ